MKKIIYFFFILLLITQSCKKNEEPIVEILTTKGPIKVKLYKETPRHRDNFIKLIKDDFYKDLIIHRINKGSSIETGDPKSKNASHNRSLGIGDINNTLLAEIVYPKLFHKKGVLSSYCLPENENPKHASDKSMFLIVTGEVFTSAELDTIELNSYKSQIDKTWKLLIAKNRKTISRINLSGDSIKLFHFQDSLIREAEKLMDTKDIFLFTDEQREMYTTIGGVPHLDKKQTVFGEVIEGLEIIEDLQNEPLDAFNRPKTDIKIISTKILR